ncbi:MAG TPA: nucleotide exchange factor GrpE [Polyangiaceae bacterium]|jgi:molecular chaperone GrpE
MQGDSNSTDGPRDRQVTVDESEQVRDAADGDAPPTPAPADPLAEAQAEAARMKDAWMRSAADFDNFRKRTRKELEDARRSGREDLLRAVLPVFDNLERAIQSALRTKDVKAVADGLAMVQRQFVEALGREGIARIPTVGQPFDPSVHEAIQQVETSEHAPGTVLAEVQPGYTQGDRLMRAAMVVVAKPKGGDGTPGAGEGAS